MDSYKIAAIDVHKSMLAVVVTDAAVEGELPFERRKFGALGSDLKALTEWLAAHQVQEVVMESTAQYWKPVWRQLGFGCRLSHPCVSLEMCAEWLSSRRRIRVCG